MKDNRVVVFGASGHAKVIIDIIESEKIYQIVGLIDNNYPIGTEILGYKIIGDDFSLLDLMNIYGFNKGVIGIGDNYIRSKVVHYIKSQCVGFEFINCIHPSANMSKHISMGIGNVVMSGVTINPSSIIGNHSILNTNSSLDHDCIMSDFTSLGPNTAIGGSCLINKYSFIGIGSSVIHNINIGKNCIIGAGSVVNKNTKNNSIYYGVPAKYISKLKLGEKYL